MSKYVILSLLVALGFAGQSNAAPETHNHGHHSTHNHGHHSTHNHGHHSTHNHGHHSG